MQIVYGQTECSPVITMARHDDALADLTGTIGQPLPNIDVAILDPKTGAVLPIGEQGEICTRGYHVMVGYNDNPEATAKAIDADGWLHTGDLGRMDCARLCRDHRAGQGDDHPRRRESVPGGDRERDARA